jgi:hypothetical protein
VNEVRIRPATPADAPEVLRAHDESGSGDSMAWDDTAACERHLAWMLVSVTSGAGENG